MLSLQFADVKYVTDNPFRLTGSSSDSTLVDLRRRASAAVKGLAVGIEPAVPARSAFGIERLAECPDLCRALADDPVELTVYRCFWFFDIPLSLLEEEDWDRLRESLQPAAGATASASHTRFLLHWHEFVRFRRPEDARQADSNLRRALSDDMLPTRLRVAVGFDAAESVVSDALQRVCRQYQMVVYQTATDHWTQARHAEACALIHVARASGLAREGWESAIEATLVPAINRWLAGGSGEEYTPDEVMSAGFLPAKCAEFELLDSLFSAADYHTPQAKLWQDGLRRKASAIAQVARDEALRLSNENHDNVRALAVIQQLQSLPLSQSWSDTLREDREILSGNTPVSAGKSPAQPDENELLPISSPPSMGTLNGIGVRPYGHQRYGNQGHYFMIMYFVVVFFPVLPIGRYLVSDAPGGGWYFHARTRFTRPMKWHLGIALGWFLCGTINAIIHSNDPAYQSTAASVAGDSASSDGVQDPQAAARDEHRARLETRLDSLHRDIEAEKVSVSAMQSRLKAQDEQRTALREEIDAERPALSAQDDAARFNAKVDKYNAMAASERKALQAFDKAAHHLDAEIKDYNKMVDELNSGGAKPDGQ